ncbi:MAG: Ig-like domain-containing protein, partial [Burkholderiaceae bacterium]
DEEEDEEEEEEEEASAAPSTDPDRTAPTVKSFSPAKRSKDAAVDDDIEITFSEDVVRGTGTIELWEGDPADGGTKIATYSSGNTEVSIDGDTLTINPADDLEADTLYFVKFAEGAVNDKAGNKLKAISDYKFTTAAEEDPTEDDEDPADASFAFKGLIASNVILTEVKTSVLNSSLTAGGDLDVTAENAATIEAENSSTAEGEGAAIGVTLAFNTIGWQAQNVLFGAVDALIGTSIGREQPALVQALVEGTDLSADGAITIDASAEESVTASIHSEASSSGASTGAGFVLASNMISAGAKALLRPSASQTERVEVTAGEGLSVTAADTAAIEAHACMAASSSGGVAVGGLVVRNDVRSAVDALVNRITL